MNKNSEKMMFKFIFIVLWLVGCTESSPFEKMGFTFNLDIGAIEVVNKIKASKAANDYVVSKNKYGSIQSIELFTPQPKKTPKQTKLTEVKLIFFPDGQMILAKFSLEDEKKKNLSAASVLEFFGEPEKSETIEFKDNNQPNQTTTYYLWEYDQGVMEANFYNFDTPSITFHLAKTPSGNKHVPKIEPTSKSMSKSK